MAEQNFQRWFGGTLSPPSPQIASILIKSTFPFYQDLPLSLLNIDFSSEKIITLNNSAIIIFTFQMRNLRTRS